MFSSTSRRVSGSLQDLLFALLGLVLNEIPLADDDSILGVTVVDELGEIRFKNSTLAGSLRIDLLRLPGV